MIKFREIGPLLIMLKKITNFILLQSCPYIYIYIIKSTLNCSENIIQISNLQQNVD